LPLLFFFIFFFFLGIGQWERGVREEERNDEKGMMICDRAIGKWTGIKRGYRATEMEAREDQVTIVDREGQLSNER